MGQRIFRIISQDVELFSRGHTKLDEEIQHFKEDIKKK
jgi:hypothetical protein